MDYFWNSQDTRTFWGMWKDHPSMTDNLKTCVFFPRMTLCKCPVAPSKPFPRQMSRDNNCSVLHSPLSVLCWATRWNYRWTTLPNHIRMKTEGRRKQFSGVCFSKLLLFSPNDAELRGWVILFVIFCWLNLKKGFKWWHMLPRSECIRRCALLL